MRNVNSFVRFVVIILALGFLGACSKGSSPLPTTPTPQPGVEPQWSDFNKPLTASPNPATTRNSLTFWTQVKVKQTGITFHDVYYVKYPDGHEVVCQEKPAWSPEFVKDYDIGGGCDLLKTTDPVGTYIGILRHTESGNGFTKTFDDITVAVQVNKG